MSRGGRGGGRGGGAGGRRMPGGPSWDMGDEIDGRPSDLFPKYDVPQSQSLSKIEQRQINYFLLFRRQVHSTPLYTRKRTTANDTLKPRRIYGQDQVNKRYCLKSKATVDPFTAIETYSQRFVEEERTLPDFSTQPFCKDLFPPELHSTLDGNDCAPSRRRKRREKRLELSNVTSLHSADELYRSQQGDDAAARVRSLAANLDDGDDEAAGGPKGDDEEDHGGDDDEGEEDYAYDDEDGGDYDAEGYFDDGDNDDMDDGDDGEAVY
ncbi:DNA-directed RNA polymerase III subunit C31 [Ceratocystis pirilliformis]|uniref:DNA-directed RNA polymerase III subunit n=1 Tax=Ceratocystis pirilliformis TaxID=259994 RepID=A0ABR3ZAW4_9PEZI